MYAIINISGKQYKTQIGSRLRVPRQTLETGSKVTFEDVLLFSDGKSTKIGNPNVKGGSVNAKILTHAREKKVLIYNTHCLIFQDLQTVPLHEQHNHQ